MIPKSLKETYAVVEEISVYAWITASTAMWCYALYGAYLSPMKGVIIHIDTYGEATFEVILNTILMLMTANFIRKKIRDNKLGDEEDLNI